MAKKLAKLGTKGQRIRAHRKMWRWLGENPVRKKFEWPGWEENGGRYSAQLANCFLCVYDCKNCPLVWPLGGTCAGEKELFSLWIQTWEEERLNWLNSSERFIKRREELAKEIAELPRRPQPSKARKEERYEGIFRKD